MGFSVLQQHQCCNELLRNRVQGEGSHQWWPLGAFWTTHGGNCQVCVTLTKMTYLHLAKTALSAVSSLLQLLFDVSRTIYIVYVFVFVGQPLCMNNSQRWWTCCGQGCWKTTRKTGDESTRYWCHEAAGCAQKNVVFIQRYNLTKTLSSRRSEKGEMDLTSQFALVLIRNFPSIPNHIYFIFLFS